MFKKIEEFLFGKIAGRMLARLAVSVAAWIAGQALGAGVHLDPNEVSLAITAGAQALYSFIKEWRDKRAK